MKKNGRKKEKFSISKYLHWIFATIKERNNINITHIYPKNKNMRQFSNSFYELPNIDNKIYG